MLGNEAEGDLQKSPKKTLFQGFFKERTWKSEGLASNVNASTISMACSWTIFVVSEICFLKPQFPWRCQVSGSVVGSVGVLRESGHI